MKLFINSGVCERIWEGNIKTKQSSGKLQLCLSIPNYLEKEKRHENVDFVFNIEGISKKSFARDLFFENISLRKKSKNSYSINSSKKILEEQCMYALIRSNTVVPDDVFIPSAMKDNVKVLRRIRFIDCEADYGNFLSNVYLIKINLGCNESIPIYLTYNNPKFLEEHYVFYKTNGHDEYQIPKKLKTFIRIDEYNKNQYISLSELCN